MPTERPDLHPASPGIDSPSRAQNERLFASTSSRSPAAVIFALAAGKAATGAAPGNPVLRAEGRDTLVDGCWPPRYWRALRLTTGPGRGPPDRLAAQKP